MDWQEMKTKLKKTPLTKIAAKSEEPPSQRRRASAAPAPQGQATSSGGGGGANKKRGRGKERKAADLPSTSSIEEVTKLAVRELLFLKQSVGALKTAINFVVVIRRDALKMQIQGTEEYWRANAPKREEGKAVGAHPLECSKRGCVFNAILNLLNDYTETMEEGKIDLPEGSEEAFRYLLGQAPHVHDANVSAFKPIFPQPKEERPWTWVGTITSGGDSEHANAIRTLCSTFHIRDVITFAAEREGFQSPAEEALWKWLKKKA